jgi:hypothetical protein
LPFLASSHFSRVNLGEKLRKRINPSIAWNIFTLKGRRRERGKERERERERERENDEDGSKRNRC